MLKYEIVSILRNKAAYIFLLVVLLFGLKATVELQRSITSSQDTNYIKRELQYELVMHRQLLESGACYCAQRCRRCRTAKI